MHSNCCRFVNRDFQKRVARRIANGDGSMEAASSQEPEQHRQVLSQLRTMGKQKQVPVNRAGPAIQGKKGFNVRLEYLVG